MMNCIIIDDEPLAIEVVESYCNAMGSINVLKTFTSALDAVNYMNEVKAVELIFSDIEMPNISGVDFVKSLQGKKPYIIFTTAYPQYALEGYNLNAIDYLVKPIPFPRFIQAINKVKELKQLRDSNFIGNVSSAGGSNATSNDDFIFVKSEYENIKIALMDIQFIQGLKDYLKIHINGRKSVLTLMNFKDMQTKLPENDFLRVHRSYLVNINMIESIQKSKIIINELRIPIGESYKSMVYQRFGI